MSLPAPTPKYDPLNEAQNRAILAQQNLGNHKKGQNIEVGKDCAVIDTDTVTGVRYAFRIINGVPTLVSL